jgi:hypothetical protein
MVIYYVVKDNLAAEPMFKSFFVESWVSRPSLTWEKKKKGIKFFSANLCYKKYYFAFYI